MNITPEHLASKPKKIGKLNDRDVNEIVTTGGYHIVSTFDKNGELEILGVGPHRGVSRHVAKKKYPDLKITELSKADYVDPRFFEDMLPQYEELTDTLNSRVKRG